MTEGTHDVVALAEEAAKRSARQFRLDMVDSKELYRTILHVAEQAKRSAATDLSRLREALEKIERGEIDEGGARRECSNAGAIARAALYPASETKP